MKAANILTIPVIIGSLATVCIVVALWPSPSRVSLREQTSAGGLVFSEILVKAKGDFQKALLLAKPGDTIVLEAGASFVGPFTLPAKSGNEYITIQSSRLSELPKPGIRVNPSQAALMAKILASPGDAAVKTAPRAHHYQFIGIEFAPANSTATISDLIKLGDGSNAQTSPEMVPHALIIDRCFIHGSPRQDVKRGVALNSGEASIINSYISDIHVEGQDTQAVCGWNGPGPYHIINNYLEAAGENVLFGGADPSIPNLVPSDIEIRRNHFYKPLTWKVGDSTYAGKHWTVKNLLETKNARRMVIDGNLFENCWADAQVGFAILFKSQNQDGGCPWCVSEDIVFSGNIIRNADHGLNVLGYDPYHPSAQLKRLRVVNNLWENISGMWFQGTAGGDDILFEHNTHFQQSGNVMTLYGRPTTKFVYRNNITQRTGYGVKGDGTAEGNMTLQKYCPGYVFEHNVIASAVSGDYPRGNFYPPSLEHVGFVDFRNRNYRLASSSRYKKAAADGKDMGCDLDALARAVAAKTGAQSPD